MYLTLKQEFKHIRLTFTSNRMSSTFYIEQLPSYYNNEKVFVFALYFYFHGNDNLNVRKLLDTIILEGQDKDYHDIKRLMIDYCKQCNDSSDYSYSEKETSGFNIKPKDGFVIKVTGLDFDGTLAWDYFLFSKKTGERIVSTDGDSSRKLFKSQMSDNSFLSGKSYNNLINLLKDGNYHFEEINHGRR